MTPAFWCIIAMILINYLLAGVGGWLTVRQTGKLDINQPRIQDRELTGAASRVKAAQANGWEILSVFSSCVFIAHLAGVPAHESALPAYLFIISRVLYFICYAFRLSPWRTIVFVLGILANIWLIKLAIHYGG
ncbi:MAPEG family protein [Photobacterium sp. BZF1]|uniref:MAPEG family protein n=1 Tax=Photobacterium sp. BZF1 TaxID=1904457 RepID=UPI001653E54D|nr:MAPEG family protein [Photobacterium sp. BZF1]MBC7005883.1 MAPEG family protein [Photobacterium sp. BZF1]